MVLLALVVVVALVAGYLAGGRLKHLEHARIRWWWLAPLGLAMQLGPIPVHGHGGHLLAIGLLIASYPALMLFAAANLRVFGFALVMVGLAMNLTVIAVNGGMPVNRHALVASGQAGTLDYLIHHGGAKHHLARPDDDLLFLADVIPLGRPVRQVASAGDLVVYAGVVLLVVQLMRRRSPTS